MAQTRDGQEIKVGHKYMFADLKGNNVYIVTEVLDKDSVRVDDFYKSTRWACNALYEII